MPQAPNIPKPPSPAISAQAFGQVRSILATNGYSQQWIDDVLGGTHVGRSRQEIAEKLRAAL